MQSPGVLSAGPGLPSQMTGIDLLLREPQAQLPAPACGMCRRTREKHIHPGKTKNEAGIQEKQKTIQTSRAPLYISQELNSNAWHPCFVVHIHSDPPQAYNLLSRLKASSTHPGRAAWSADSITPAARPGRESQAR